MALTQAEIDRLMRERGAFTAADGNQYGYLNSSGVGSEGYGDPGIFGNGALMQGSFKPGDPYHVLDAQGADTGRTGIHGGNLPLGKMALMYAAMLAGAGAAGGMFGGAAGGGGLGANGAFLGEGAASGIPAWDGALSAAEAASAGGAGTGAAFNAAKDSQMANAAIDAAGGNALSGYQAAGIPSVAAPGAGSGGGSLWEAAKGLLPGGASNVLGTAATVLGGIAGSKGQEAGGSSERKMDPRLDKYVFDDLLPRTQGLLAQQMPVAQQYGQQMGQVGQGLLNMPAAGNGFGLFTRGRY